MATPYYEVRAEGTTIYDFVKEMENRLLSLIQINVQKMIISAQDAVQIAKDFLVVLPVSTWSDLCSKLYNLSLKYEVCRQLYLAYAVPYEEISRNKKAALLQELLNNNEISKAYSLMKGGVV